jgi:hypothetical protein
MKVEARGLFYNFVCSNPKRLVVIRAKNAFFSRKVFAALLPIFCCIIAHFRYLSTFWQQAAHIFLGIIPRRINH